MAHMDYIRLKNYIEEKGLKQKILSKNTGIPEAILSRILLGKRKCETSEYAEICAALEVPLEKFITTDPAEDKQEVS